MQAALIATTESLQHREISPNLVDEDFSSGVFSHSIHELNSGDDVGHQC